MVARGAPLEAQGLVATQGVRDGAEEHVDGLLAPQFDQAGGIGRGPLPVLPARAEFAQGAVGEANPRPDAGIPTLSVAAGGNQPSF